MGVCIPCLRVGRAGRALYLDRTDEGDIDSLAEGLLEWMPEVARYSFREVRLSGV